MMKISMYNVTCVAMCISAGCVCSANPKGMVIQELAAATCGYQTCLQLCKMQLAYQSATRRSTSNTKHQTDAAWWSPWAEMTTACHQLFGTHTHQGPTPMQPPQRTSTIEVCFYMKPPALDTEAASSPMSWTVLHMWYQDNTITAHNRQIVTTPTTQSQQHCFNHNMSQPTPSDTRRTCCST